MTKSDELLADELRSLEKRISKVVTEFRSKYSSHIPITHKLSVSLTSNYSTAENQIRCRAEINKRSKTWSEMVIEPLTKDDWDKIFKADFLSQLNQKGRVQSARFFELLKKLENGGEDCRKISLTRMGEVERWLVAMKETDRCEINRMLDYSGLQQYGIVNHEKGYNRNSVVMAKFW